MSNSKLALACLSFSVALPAFADSMPSTGVMEKSSASRKPPVACNTVEGLNAHFDRSAMALQQKITEAEAQVTRASAALEVIDTRLRAHGVKFEGQPVPTLEDFKKGEVMKLLGERQEAMLLFARNQSFVAGLKQARLFQASCQDAMPESMPSIGLPAGGGPSTGVPKPVIPDPKHKGNQFQAPSSRPSVGTGS